ncbi:MAG: rhomboid family intramembrane serine protease [Verrucomicrobia subdivision 3 bacterium]|nr:rhomboid family intramembrane serine protease [Limisphaerales bacterium]
MYSDALWSLITSTFVHIDILHLAFNLYWLFHLGRTLERAIGSSLWLAFFILTSVVSSGYQLAFSDSTGYGASGVVYAMFGFMLMTRKYFPGFAEMLDRQTIAIFVIWLVGCLIATAVGAVEIGNAAHITGILFGIGSGALVVRKRFRRLIIAGLALFTLTSILFVFWAPWSAQWTSWRAYEAHTKGKYKSAIRWYERADALGFDKSWCLYNKAMAHWTLGDTSSYRRVLASLAKLDSSQAEELEREIRQTNWVYKTGGR